MTLNECIAALISKGANDLLSSASFVHNHSSISHLEINKLKLGMKTAWHYTSQGFHHNGQLTIHMNTADKLSAAKFSIIQYGIQAWTYNAEREASIVGLWLLEHLEIKELIKQSQEYNKQKRLDYFDMLRN